MKKKVIFGYWFYNITSIIFIGMGVIGIIFVYKYDGPFWAYIPFIVNVAYFSIIGFVYLFQLTVFSDTGIKTKTVGRTIRELKWDEVKEVRYERFYVSVAGGFTSGWYVIDDGVVRQQRNGLVRKNSHITVRATKRARKVIEEFWHGPIVEKQISN